MGEARGLTEGEVREAKTIFVTTINYDKVVVHQDRAYFFQPDDTAITPNGERYFPVKNYRSDFSGNAADMSWMIHELTHVWQSQRGMWVRTRGTLNRNYAYGDLTKTKLDFLDQGIEVQAALVEDYYRLTNKIAARHGSGSLSDYDAIIPFLPAGK